MSSLSALSEYKSGCPGGCTGLGIDGHPALEDGCALLTHSRTSLIAELSFITLHFVLVPNLSILPTHPVQSISLDFGTIRRRHQLSDHAQASQNMHRVLYAPAEM